MSATNSSKMVGFDIAGVLVCLLLDVVWFGDSNTLESYAVWFVLGSLCGLFSYNTAGRVASPKSKADGTNQRETGIYHQPSGISGVADDS